MIEYISVKIKFYKKTRKSSAIKNTDKSEKSIMYLRKTSKSKIQVKNKAKILLTQQVEWIRLMENRGLIHSTYFIVSIY